MDGSEHETRHWCPLFCATHHCGLSRHATLENCRTDYNLSKIYDTRVALPRSPFGLLADDRGQALVSESTSFLAQVSGQCAPKALFEVQSSMLHEEPQTYDVEP